MKKQNSMINSRTSWWMTKKSPLRLKKFLVNIQIIEPTDENLTKGPMIVITSNEAWESIDVNYQNNTAIDLVVDSMLCSTVTKLGKIIASD